MSKPVVVITLPQPQVAGAIYIVVPPAEAIGNGDWRGSARIVWPDGSYDVGASGLIGKTKKEAEVLAETKACDRWAAIERGSLNKSHPVP
jgi:hypothetical protein